MFRPLLLFCIVGVIVTSTSAQTLKSCDLTYIWLSNGVQLTPTFRSNLYSYTAEVDNAIASVQQVVWAVDKGSSIKIQTNGANVQYVGTGGMSTPITLTSGSVTTIATSIECGDCKQTYYIYIYRKPPQEGGVQGDPQFTGLHGQDYQVHGVPGEIYNLISDSDIQLNARFVFLNHGHCPIINGQEAEACWTHPGTYLGELGLKTCSGDRLHIVAGSAHHGFAKVELNGQLLQVGQMAPLICDHAHNEAEKQENDAEDETVSNGWVAYNHTHGLTIQVGVFEIAVENSDFFVNQQIKVLDWNSIHSHGLIGVTWRDAKHPGQIKYIEGDVDSYMIQERQIWGDKFVFNQFHIDKD